MKEEALIYLGKNSKRKNELYPVFKKYDISPIFISDENMQDTILSLFTEANSSAPCTLFPFDFILFKHNDRDIILPFYQDSKTIFPFTHKAILTEHNGTWKLYDLLQEMEEEHQFFQKWEQLHTLLREANDKDPNQYETISYEPYKQAFIKGYILTKQGKPTMEALTRVISEIKETKQLLIQKKV